MWETSRPLSVAVAGYAIAASVLPNLVLIAAGHLIGQIPAAARTGLASAAGHRTAADHGADGAAAAVAGGLRRGGWCCNGVLDRAGGLYAELYELQARAYR